MLSWWSQLTFFYFNTKSFFWHLYKGAPVLRNSHSFFLVQSLFLLYFYRTSMMGIIVFSSRFVHFECISSHSFLVFKVSAGKYIDGLMGLPWMWQIVFLLLLSKFLFIFDFENLILTCLSAHFFTFGISGILWYLWIWMWTSLFRGGKFSVIISFLEVEARTYFNIG